MQTGDDSAARPDSPEAADIRTREPIDRLSGTSAQELRLSVKAGYDDPGKTGAPDGGAAGTAQLTASVAAFVDTNILLECRELDQLPWAEIDPVGPIRVLVTPRVAHEVDKRKRDGRLATRARAVNRLLGAALASGEAVIQEAGPRVTLARSAPAPIDWTKLDGLDPDEADHRIVAEILHARDVLPAEKVVVSHDINPLGLARDRSLRIHHVDDHWLRPPEPSPADKEIQRLKGRLRELETQQPSFEVTIDVDGGTPARVFRVGPLSPAQRRDLLEDLISRNPRPPNGRIGGAFDPTADSSFDGRWKRYVDEVLPAFAAAWPRKVELMYNQRRLRITLHNAGLIQASDLTVEIAASDGWINGAFVMVGRGGPPAPEPRDVLNYAYAGLVSRYTGFRVDRHEFGWLEGPERARRCRAACAAFPSGQDWTFEGSLFLDAHIPAPTTVTVTVRASNLTGAVTETLEIVKMVEDVAGYVPMDPERPDLGEAPIVPYLLDALRRSDTDMIDYDGADDD